MNVWLCNIRCKRHYIVAFYCFLFPARWFPLPARPKETTSTISSSCMCLSILSRNLQCGSLPANFLTFIHYTYFLHCLYCTFDSFLFYSVSYWGYSDRETTPSIAITHTRSPCFTFKLRYMKLSKFEGSTW